MSTDAKRGKKRLGRGLNALLGEPADEQANDAEPQAADQAQPSSDGQPIKLDLIDPNPFQPRREFAKESLAELAASIKRHGILQPLLVRKAGDRFQLIAGERRLRSAKVAGLSEVPVRVMELDDRQVCEAAIEENLKRQDLNVLEKAQAFQDYLERFQCSIEDLSKQLSMSRSNVSNMLRLLELPDAVKAFLSNNAISPGHARAILPTDDAKQLELCHRIQRESLSVRATEAVVREYLAAEESGDSKKATSKAAPPEVSNHVRSMQDHLREKLGAKVEIKVSAKNAGKVIVHFGSSDEFEQLVKKLRNAA